MSKGFKHNQAYRFVSLKDKHVIEVVRIQVTPSSSVTSLVTAVASSGSTTTVSSTAVPAKGEDTVPATTTPSVTSVVTSSPLDASQTSTVSSTSAGDTDTTAVTCGWVYPTATATTTSLSALSPVLTSAATPISVTEGSQGTDVTAIVTSPPDQQASSEVVTIAVPLTHSTTTTTTTIGWIGVADSTPANVKPTNVNVSAPATSVTLSSSEATSATTQDPSSGQGSNVITTSAPSIPSSTAVTTSSVTVSGGTVPVAVIRPTPSPLPQSADVTKPSTQLTASVVTPIPSATVAAMATGVTKLSVTSPIPSTSSTTSDNANNDPTPQVHKTEASKTSSTFTISKWSDVPSQKFRSLRTKPGVFRVHSLQHPKESWDAEFTNQPLLKQTEWTSSPTQGWIAEPIIANQNLYFIKPKINTKLCLQNMGLGKPLSFANEDRKNTSLHWKLEPVMA